MKRLGVTGGMGSGKSYVCRVLTEGFGIPVYNCDIRARIITLTDIDVIDALTALDKDLYDEQNQLDKVHLAQYMFSSEEHYKQVNQIIHPAVRDDLREWMSLRHAPLVAVESAILYESHFETEVDHVLFVDAPLEVRVQRIMARDGLEQAQIKQRLQRQHPEAARQRADYVLMNDGQTNVKQQLKSILRSLVPEIL